MPTEDILLRRAVVFASALAYWAGVFLHARRVRHRIGRSPNVAPQGAKERWLWIGWFIVAMGWMLQPVWAGTNASWSAIRTPATTLLPGGLAAGMALVVAGYAGTLWCYASMGEAWRMGVDRNERTALVTRGPYRWVRHPIYSFQVWMLLGALLLLPTPFSLALLLLHLVCVRAKVADEETHLSTLHGDGYREYQAATGRLIPRLRPARRESRSAG